MRIFSRHGTQSNDFAERVPRDLFDGGRWLFYGKRQALVLGKIQQSSGVVDSHPLILSAKREIAAVLSGLREANPAETGKCNAAVHGPCGAATLKR